MAGGIQSVNSWIRKIGRAGGSGAVDMQSQIIEFAAADLDFNTGYNTAGLLIPSQQGTVVIPHSVFVSYKNVVTPPNNVHAEGYDLVIYKQSTNEFTTVGQFRKELFSPSYSDAVIMCPLTGNLEETIMKRIASLVDTRLIWRPKTNESPNGHSGGDYSLKFRVVYERIDINDFI